jgi:endonuclease YncB( thermonuclease family)
VEVSTRLFWGLISALLSLSLYFGLNAESRRRELQKSEASVETGEIVRLERVVDGDTLLVKKESGDAVAIRLLGIKAFDSKPEKDELSRFGKAAIGTLERLAANEPLRVLVHTTPKDRHGRTLATLYSGDNDLALTLIKDGVALVYTVYPFPSMPFYLKEQEGSRADRKGLWADVEASKRADLLAREWRREVD